MKTWDPEDEQKQPEAVLPGTENDLPLARLAVGLGDAEREQRLLPALGESGEWVLVDRCLSAEQVLACLREGRADAALVAFDLHRLTAASLADLARTRAPGVLLAPDPDAPRWRALGDLIVLDLQADAASVHQALSAALRGESLQADAVPDEWTEHPEVAAPTTATTRAECSVIAVGGGTGGPGRTTVAINLAAALGAVAPTLLVDADLSAPSVAAYIDADPTRNLYMLAHAEPATPRAWEVALQQETQPLARRSPHGAVLCGVPKPEMRSAISVALFERLLAELRQRARYVVLDVGAEVLGAEAGVHRAALSVADQVLVVASADLVGLWRARTALSVLHTHLDLPSEHIALAINRHDPRYHQGRGEIEWALGVPTAAVIPYDYGAAQRALAAQRPLVLHGRSRAARALLDLAERVCGGDIALPAEQRAEQDPRGVRWARALRLPWPRPRRPVSSEAGFSHGTSIGSSRP